MATVIIEADSSGEYLHIEVTPDCGFLKIEPDLAIHPDQTRIVVDRILGTNRLTIRGRIQPGRRYVEKVSVHDPTRYFLTGLKWELVRLGINVYGEPRDSDQLADGKRANPTRLLFVHRSPAFKDVLTIMMKESQNLYAESLVKLLGHHFGAAGSFEQGARVIKQTLSRFGLEKDRYSFMDGSGLCRYNYISPAYLVKILRNIYYHPYGKIYLNSLPIAGVDGTIGYRLKRTVAQGKTYAKTGTISNVRCLSGYATTRDGETLVFSTMFNNFLCSVNVVMDIQDRICMLLTSFSRKRSNL